MEDADDSDGGVRWVVGRTEVWLGPVLWAQLRPRPARDTVSVAGSSSRRTSSRRISVTSGSRGRGVRRSSYRSYRS